MCLQAFQPLSAQLVKLDQTPANTQGSAVTVKVPHQEQHQLAQLGVMLLTVGTLARPAASLRSNFACGSLATSSWDHTLVAPGPEAAELRTRAVLPEIALQCNKEMFTTSLACSWNEDFASTSGVQMPQVALQWLDGVKAKI